MQEIVRYRELRKWQLDCDDGKHGYQQSPLLLYEAHYLGGVRDVT